MTQKRLMARGLGKRYLRDAGPGQHLANLLLGREKGTPFWALHPLDIDLSAGDALGVIGRNGSGKSTLLQLLMGTLTPSVGAVTATGRVAGLLELGAGFNPDFTGRENAVMNAISLGLTPFETSERLPQIEEFAGIGPYFERPVREYSSGMFARLAFSVAVHVDADVMIIDEILAVGDAEFQHRCLRRLQTFRENGGAFVFVSQNANEMASVCQNAIWLDHGRVQAFGPSDEVAAAYQRALVGALKEGSELGTAVGLAPPDTARFPSPMRVQVGAYNPHAPQHGQGGAKVIDVTWLKPDGEPASAFEGGEEIQMCIHCRAERDLTRPIVGFIFRDARGQNLFGDNSYLTTADNPPRIPAGGLFVTRFRFRFPYLLTGRYQLAPSIIEGTQEHHVHLHWIEEAVEILVTQSPVDFGVIGVPMIKASLTTAG